MSAMGVYPSLIQKAAAEGYMPYLGGERVRGGEGIHIQSITTAVQSLLEPFSKLPVRFAYASVGGITPPLDELDRMQYNTSGDHSVFSQMFSLDPTIHTLLGTSRLILDMGRRRDMVLAGEELDHTIPASQGLIAISQGAHAVVESCVGGGMIDVSQGNIGVYGSFQSNESLSDDAMQHYLAFLERLAESGDDVQIRGTIIDWAKSVVPISFSRHHGKKFTICGDRGHNSEVVGIGGLLGIMAKTHDEMKMDPPKKHTTYLAFTVPQIALEK